LVQTGASLPGRPRFFRIEAEWPGCAEPQSGRAYGR